MKKQAFVLTLGVVLLSVVAGLGMLIKAQSLGAASGAGAGNRVGRGAGEGRGKGEGSGAARAGNNYPGGELPSFWTLHTQQPDDLSRPRQECFRGQDFHNFAGGDDAEEGRGL